MWKYKNMKVGNIMALFKVEICGVNTAKLPLLTEEEKRELFKEIKKGNMEALRTALREVK